MQILPLSTHHHKEFQCKKAMITVQYTSYINRPLATLYCVMYANVVLMTCLFQAAVVFQVAVNDCTPTCGRDGGLVISQ